MYRPSVSDWPWWTGKGEGFCEIVRAILGSSCRGRAYTVALSRCEVDLCDKCGSVRFFVYGGSLIKPDENDGESDADEPRGRDYQRKAQAEEKATLPPETIKAIDAMLEGRTDLEDFFGPDGVLKELVAAVMNRAMETEMTSHLGYARGEEPPEGQTNRRNGHGSKTLRGDLGEVETAIPRDREGTFEPRLVKKHERSMRGFDQKILAMYARGMSARDIQGHLQEIYGIDVSPQLVSDVTEAVSDEVRAWQRGCQEFRVRRQRMVWKEGQLGRRAPKAMANCRRALVQSGVRWPHVFCAFLMAR